MKPTLSIALLVCLSLNVGCANKTRTGALVGTGAGAGVGAIIGHQIGKGKEGALIGAAIGGVTGSVLGHKDDVKDEQESTARNVAHMEEQREASARAMTNFDVIEMSHAQMSEALIISTMQDRGGAFDTSPTGIIGLKKDGVSETVIMAMQRHNKTR